MTSYLKLQRSIPIRESAISCCEWSPSGTLLAVGLQSGDIQIVNSAGTCLCSAAIGDAIQSVTWSPDEHLIAVATAWDRIVLLRSNDLKGIREFPAHTGGVWGAAFSPDGTMIASAGADGNVILSHVAGGFSILAKQNDQVFALAWLNDEHLATCTDDGTLTLHPTSGARLIVHLSSTVGIHFPHSLLCIGISSSGKTIAIGSKGGSIYLTTGQGKATLELEGHTSWVWSVAFIAQDRILVSESEDHTIRFWETQSGSLLSTIKTNKKVQGNVAVNSAKNVIAIPNDIRHVIEIWSIDTAALLASFSQDIVTHYCSAKVALVGESNVGKSCLALRLAENRYEEVGTTHGMRFWPIDPLKLDPSNTVPKNQKRDVILWDMGGQDEYRLIHQLFLHDTTVALILLDPTRGRTAFEEAEGWAKRLEKQLAGRNAAKILVGTKLDLESELIDKHGLERLVKDQHFEGYYPTSAKTGRGLRDLGKAITNVLDWDSLARTTRPQLFQTVRNEVEKARAAREIVLLRKDLEDRVRRIETLNFDVAAVGTVVSQLALQGLIAMTRLSSGEQALVLSVENIEIYAGSVLVAAKNNPRGVPAIQELSLMSEDMKFPGIVESARLPRLQERIVLECVIQLFIEHGICIEHEGLLIFPSLFVPTEPDSQDEIGHTVSLYYDFSGAIDNIYSSLISAITISEKFGAVRLWDNRAEFTKAGQGSCGLRKVSRQRGFAHLDIYTSEDATDVTRDLFISVVEEHLARHGVDIYEHVEVTCLCGHQFTETTIRQRIADGHSEIGCPVCDRRVRISEGAKQVRQKDPDIERSTWALRSQIRKAKNDAVARAKRNISKASRANLEDSIRVLHLSDLHISALTKPDEMLGPLCSDLRDKKNGLGYKELDYLVISGDISDHGQQVEFEIARKFVSGIISEFGLNAERCIVVPGNHDINWEVDVYDWLPKRRVRKELVGTNDCLEQGTGYLIRNDAYNDRLKAFSDDFHHTLIQKPYPLDPEKQASEFYFPGDSLQFICLNSCWEIDEHFPDRSGINKSAVAEGLRHADMILRQENVQQDKIFRIGVFHHPVTGNEKIQDDAFLSQLRRAGIKLILHGHVHEERVDLIGYVDPTTSVHVAGAGSFGAPMRARPESTPRLYNVIELSRKLDNARVHTRCLRKNGGAWEGWAAWPSSNDMERRSFYEIKFRS